MFLRIKCALRNKCIWQSNAECNIMSASFPLVKRLPRTLPRSVPSVRSIPSPPCCGFSLCYPETLASSEQHWFGPVLASGQHICSPLPHSIVLSGS